MQVAFHYVGQDHEWTTTSTCREQPVGDGNSTVKENTDSGVLH